jgi:hypothetical protein
MTSLTTLKRATRRAADWGYAPRYFDFFHDFIGFIEPRLVEAYHILKSNGSLYFHND